MLVADSIDISPPTSAPRAATCELQVWPDQVHVFQALPTADTGGRPRHAADRRVHRGRRCATTHRSRRRVRRMGIFGSSTQAQSQCRRGHHRRRQWHRRGVRRRTRPPRRPGRLQRHRRNRRAQQRPTPSSPRAARHWRCAATSPSSTTSRQLAEGRAGLVRRPADAGDQQRRRRRGRNARSATPTSTTGTGCSASTCGARSTVVTCSRRSCARPATAASSTSRPPPRSARLPGMAAYNVSKAGVLSLSETLAAELSGTGVQRHRAVPDVRQDQHRRVRPDHATSRRRWRTG